MLGDDDFSLLGYGGCPHRFLLFETVAQQCEGSKSTSFHLLAIGPA